VLNEKQTQTQRLDLLIRQGMMPARQLPILHRALANMKMGKILTPYERDAMQQLLDKMMAFQFGDDITFNRARLHTQKTKYQTEENDVEESADVIIFDGNKDEQEAKRDKKVKKKASKQFKDTDGPGQSNAEEEDMKEELARANRPADKQEGDTESPKQGGSVVPQIIDGPKQSGKPGAEEPSSHSKTAKVSEGRPDIGEGILEGKFKRRNRDMEGLPKSLKEKAGVKESVISKDIKAFNDAYKEHLTKSLEDHGVENIRDIPQEAKKEFFTDLDEKITDQHLKQAKGIAFDKRYKGGNYSGAAKAMEKVKKGLSDHPEALKHLQHANEQVETPLDEGSLKDYALGHGYFDNSGEGKRKRADNDWLSKQSAHGKKTLAYPKKKVLKSDRKEEVEMEGTMVPGFIGADGKATSKPTKKDFDSNKEYQSMKKKLGKRIPGPAVKEATAAEVLKKRMSSQHPDDNPQATKRIDDDKGGMKTYKMHPGAKFQPGTGDISQKGKTAAIKKQLKRRPKQYGVTEGEDKEENPLPKTPNQAIRDVHKTVRDVMRGGPEETVSDVPLVVDPNVELQKETDRLYNDVQESARSDAMRDIKADSGRGMAPLKTDAPKKKSKHDGSANKGPEHIVAQMRKAISLGDKHDGVKFKDGKTHKVSSVHAHKFLNKYMEGKPADKTKMQDHAHASHDNFKKHVE